MKKLLPFLFGIAFFSSCNKDEVNRPTDETDKVFVRIENRADIIMENAHIGTTVYGNVATGTVTDYKTVTNSLYEGFGYCRFINNGNEVLAGHLMWCGTPPLPPLFEPGYYTFTVEPATDGHNEVTVTKL